MATASEQRWLRENRDYAIQVFGTDNPPDGAVAELVRNYYASGGTPDETDSAILREFGAPTTPAAPAPSAPQTGGQVLGPTAYNQLLARYQALGGSEVQSPAGQQRFNAWTDQLMSQYGVGTWEELPIAAVSDTPSVSTGDGGGVQAPPLPSGGGGSTAIPSVGSSAPSVLTNTINAAALQGANNVANGGDNNLNQVQASTQQGQFVSQGSTSQNTTQSGTQQQSTTATQTTAPVDTLGIGALLKDQAMGMTGIDSERQAWLSDLMKTGGAEFNSQIDQAVRQSLSGPHMTGAGESARARAAGYAAAETGRNNLNQRLAASQQLSGPTGLSNLASASTPWLGSTTTGQTDANLSSLNIGSLVSNESQSGSSTASSGQVATGQVPEGQKIEQSGGCYVCTAYVYLKRMSPDVVRRGAKYKLSNLSKYGLSLLGYSVYGPLLARAVLASRVFAWAFYPVARAVLYEECRRATGVRLPRRAFATLCHAGFHYGSEWVGATARLVGRHKIETRDEGMKQFLAQNNLLFNID
jgi:hypothetical protein